MTDPNPGPSPNPNEIQISGDVLKLASKAAFFILLGLSYFCLPLRAGYVANYHHADKGLEYAFNYFPRFGLVYGRDIFFGYGPLAYLMAPIAVGSHLLQANILIVAVHTVLAALLWSLARRTGDYLRPLPMVIALFLPLSADTALDVTLTLIGVLCYVESVLNKRSLAFVLPTLFAAFFMYAKLSIGLCLSMLFVVYLFFSWWIHKDSPRAAALRCGVYLAAFGALGFLCYRSFADFANGFRVSFLLAHGFSEATSLCGKIEEMYMAVLMMPLLLVPAKWIRDVHGKRVALCWLFLIAAAGFISFKHSFVRADWHIQYFFTFFPAAMASSCLILPLRKNGLIVLIAFILASQGTAGRFQPMNPMTRISAANAEGIESLLNPRQAREKAAKINEANLAADTLSGGEIESIGQGTVDALPFDAFLIGDHKVRWKPNPVVQMYYVYTREVDRWLEKYYGGDGAADFIVLRWQDVDGRHPMYTAPAAYREILNRYEFVSQTNDQLLLKKGPSRPLKTKLLKSTTGAWNERVEIPPSDKIVYAEIRLRVTLLAGLTRLLYRVPPTLIELMPESGNGTAFRFVPGTAVNGLMVSRVPMGIKEMRALIEKKEPSPESLKFVSFKLVPAYKTGFFKPTFDVDFYELDLTPA